MFNYDTGFPGYLKDATALHTLFYNSQRDVAIHEAMDSHVLNILDLTAAWATDALSEFSVF